MYSTLTDASNPGRLPCPFVFYRNKSSFAAVIRRKIQYSVHRFACYFDPTVVRKQPSSIVIYGRLWCFVCYFDSIFVHRASGLELPTAACWLATRVRWCPRDSRLCRLAAISHRHWGFLSPDCASELLFSVQLSLQSVAACTVKDRGSVGEDGGRENGRDRWRRGIKIKRDY